MKLNTKFTVSVKNKGEENVTNINVDLKAKWADIVTSLELAKKSLQGAMLDYMSSKISEIGRPLSEKEAHEIMKSVKFEELYNKRQSN